MENAENTGIIAWILHKQRGQMVSNSNKKETKARISMLLLWTGGTLHEHMSLQEESRFVKEVQSSPIWLFAVDKEEYAPTDDESMKEKGF